ncbi:MAG: SpoIID/LytB domain-containing protein [Pyrinomonadaceae bacterium]|nr:SpoIID/LytB domain-containing protein [Pyrinomonadaceae bacterium]
MKFCRFLVFKLILAASCVAIAAGTPLYTPPLPAAEPLVRIGLIRNSSTVTISTRGSTLAGNVLGAPVTSLGTSTVRISSRSYRPPQYGIYRFEIPAIETREEADDLAANIANETGESVSVFSEGDDGTWSVKFATERDSKADADAFVALIEEKGFIGVKVSVEKYTSPSDEAIWLSRQISSNPKSHVRSLSDFVPAKAHRPGIIKISSSRPVRKNMNAPIMSGLRELTVSGSTAASKFSSLRSLTVGSLAPGGIVYLNGKRYRGRMEVFVNKKNRLTVVNVVPMEQYLLGVVPAELSLPRIEAQKAQAVAARTYAAANKNDYGDEGFDMLPTVWSQVYKGVAIESRMGSRAVRETRGVLATYEGRPINAMYTSTCGGRTEDSGNIYPFDEPYLRGVNCSLDGRQHFTPFLVKTTREPALIRNEANYEFVRLASRYAVNNFVLITNRFDDQYFEEPPTKTELISWLTRLSLKFNKPFPRVEEDSARPLKLARLLHSIIYSPDSEADADALMSASDVDYQLSFLDAGEVPAEDRVMLAELLRDGWFSIYSDLTIKPNKSYSRGKILSLIDHIYSKKKWSFSFNTGTANPTEDGKLILKSGRSEKEIILEPNLFLFRKFGDSFYQVKEAALVGGEKVRYKLDSVGKVNYLEIEPTEKTTVAERMSPFTTWRKSLSNAQIRSRLSRYVKGMGQLIDIKVKSRGFSRRATELEITSTRGVHSLKGGKIRSALRLREQLFVMDKRYGSNGRVSRISFTGRGWGHGIGMCQYGAYGLAKMGVKYDRILRHYYTDIDLVKAY